MSDFADEHDVPSMTPAVRWLIALNAAVFFLQFALFGAGNVQAALGYRVVDLPSHWWTPLSYSFVHAGFWTLALNMYLLFLFGPRLEQEWGTRAFRNFYLWCGFGGLLLHTVLVRESPLLGATGAVMGVALAYTMRWPDEEVYLFLTFPIRVRWLVSMLLAITLAVGAIQAGDGHALPYLTHLGGLAAAWVFGRTSSVGAGFDRLRQRVSPVPEVPDEPPRAVPRSMPRTRERSREVDEIVAQSQQALARRTGPAPAPTRPAAESMTELDRVLDKISELGIDSLTIDERRVLEERSRELRKDR